MNFTVLTLFPDIVRGFFQDSIMAKSVQSSRISYDLVQIRDFAEDKHRTCDDAPYGGGAGMVLKPQPLGKALESVKAQGKRVVYPTPSGRLFTQDYAAELAQENELVFICGRYEGIDQRIIDLYVDDEICIGDYVISSGEIAALVIIDAVYRLIDGVISQRSLDEESFSDGLLEYPHYTRPAEYCGMSVPDILLSGHHAQIEQWRLHKRVEKTLKNRPDLAEAVMKRPELKHVFDAVHDDIKAKG
jgi:tRNA (guanine37-N1)-methyltransferase